VRAEEADCKGQDFIDEGQPYVLRHKLQDQLVLLLQGQQHSHAY
jgi:hypothetical protein